MVWVPAFAGMMILGGRNKPYKYGTVFGCDPWKNPGSIASQGKMKYNWRVT